MNATSLIVDGMLSGTGIRDAVVGGYVKPKEIGVSHALSERIKDWLKRYEHAHYHQYEDKETNDVLDKDGIEIAKKLKIELPKARVSYFSNVRLVEIEF